MKLKPIKKRQAKYVISRNFYSHLAFYILFSLFILAVLIFSITSVSYLAGVPTSSFPLDACDKASEDFNYFYCLIIDAKDSPFFNSIFYFLLVLIIVAILALIILNVIFIVNRFYFVRLVKEKSCGAVIYKIENNKIFYLLLKMGYGHTSLCKGHQEEGESDEETAIREIKEETSLDVKLDTSFKIKITYSPSELSLKDVYFYLATPIDTSVVPKDEHDNEVDSLEWCDFDEAMYKITYDSDRNVLYKAHKYILKNFSEKK